MLVDLHIVTEGFDDEVWTGVIHEYYVTDADETFDDSLGELAMGGAPEVRVAC